MGRTRPGIIVIGTGLIVTGIAIVVTQLGLFTLGFTRLWPAIPALFGMALLAESRVKNEYLRGNLALGWFVLLCSVSLFVFTLQIGGATWRDMGRFWPFIFLFASFAFLVVYMAGDLTEYNLLTPVYTFSGLGAVLLLISTGYFADPAFRLALKLWPLPVLFAGAAAFLLYSHAPADASTADQQSE